MAPFKSSSPDFLTILCAGTVSSDERNNRTLILNICLIEENGKCHHMIRMVTIFPDPTISANMYTLHWVICTKLKISIEKHEHLKHAWQFYVTNRQSTMVTGRSPFGILSNIGLWQGGSDGIWWTRWLFIMALVSTSCMCCLSYTFLCVISSLQPPRKASIPVVAEGTVCKQLFMVIQF